MSVLRISLPSLVATERFGALLAELLHPGDRLQLIGEMGAGKTMLARAIGGALHADPPLTSPTFVLLAEHEGLMPIWHLDAYRLPVGGDPFAAGLLDERQVSGLTIIEWADRLQWPAGEDGASGLRIALAQGEHEDERSATIQFSDPARRAALRDALQRAGIVVHDA